MQHGQDKQQRGCPAFAALGGVEESSCLAYELPLGDGSVAAVMPQKPMCDTATHHHGEPGWGPVGVQDRAEWGEEEVAKIGITRPAATATLHC